MTTRHATTDDLRAALTAAIPDLTEDQADAARALLEALAPPMQEPTWPGAPVIAGCGGTALRRLHTRRNDGPTSGWECAYSCESTSWHVLGNPRPLTPAEYAYSCESTSWHVLVNPRPLTPAEYAEHRIPMPCTHTTAEETA